MVSTDAIAAMKAMAADPVKRIVLAKDATCVGGLVVVLSNKDSKIVQLALETLLMLADVPETTSSIVSFVGLQEQLTSLINKPDTDGSVKDMASRLYHIVTDMEQTPLKDTSNLHNTSTRSNTSASCQKHHSTSHHSSRNKSITLQLRGLVDRADRELCMRLLLQVKGVISITFDLKRKRCIVRTKLDVKPENLVQAIARSQTMTAQQVVRNEKGEETLLSFNLHRDVDKENAAEMPSYLSDDAESPVVDAKAIARTGQTEKKGSSWLTAAASFLSNSFYW